MLDIRNELHNFEPVDMQLLEADDIECSENAKLAYTLYNKALKKIADGYDDIARIDLKKAVSLFPDFSQAVILLGACTFINGDRIGAVRIFNSVKEPVARERALSYLDYLAEASERQLSPRDHYGDIRSSAHKRRADIDDIMSERPKLESIIGADAKSDAKGAVKGEEYIDDDVDVRAATAITDGVQERGAAQPDEPIEPSGSDIEDDDIKIARSPAPPEAERIRNYRFEVDDGREDLKVEYRAAAPAEKDDIIIRRRAEPVRQNAAADSVKTARQADKDRSNERQAKNGSVFQVFSIAVLIFCVILIILLVITTDKNKELRDKLAKYEDGTSFVNGGATNPPAETAPGETPSSTEPAENDEMLRADILKSIEQAKTYEKASDHYNVVKTLSNLDLSVVSIQDKASAETMYSDALEKFTREYFNSMYSQVGKENWPEVIKYGLPIYEYNPDYSQNSAVFFSLGKAYEFTNDKENAAKFYNLTIEKFPGTNDASYATYRLRNMN